jgi:hypothetical protein
LYNFFIILLTANLFIFNSAVNIKSINIEEKDKIIDLFNNSNQNTSIDLVNITINNIKNNSNSLDIAFLLLIISFKLSKERDISSYQAWNSLLNIYSKKNTSLQIEKIILEEKNKDIFSNKEFKEYNGPELNYKRKNIEIYKALKDINEFINSKKSINNLELIKSPILTVTETQAIPNKTLTITESKIIPNKILVNKNVIKKNNLNPIRIDLNNKDIDIAKTAWKYFENNYNHETGLINSSIKYPFTTLWDLASSLAMLVSAEKLELIDKKKFDTYISKILKTLYTIELYNNELPNREYNTTNLKMTISGVKTNIGSGWSSIDIGRTLLWLKIIKKWYPEYSKDIDKIVSKWNFKRLKMNDQMNGIYNNGKKEVLRQEGRLGYEQYSAKGFDFWGIKLKNALDYKQTKKINIMSTDLIYDTRNLAYLTSEPFFLARLEIGKIDTIFDELSNKIYNIQKKRWKQMHIFTAISEDSLDKFPWFIYSSIFFNNKEWISTSSRGISYPNTKMISSKTVFAWDSIFDDEYTKLLKERVISLNNTKFGYYTGIYEHDDSLNRSININTNAIILESILYKKMNKKSFLEN